MRTLLGIGAVSSPRSPPGVESIDCCRVLSVTTTTTESPGGSSIITDFSAMIRLGILDERVSSKASNPWSLPRGALVSAFAPGIPMVPYSACAGFRQQCPIWMKCSRRRGCASNPMYVWLTSSLPLGQATRRLAPVLGRSCVPVFVCTPSSCICYRACIRGPHRHPQLLARVWCDRNVTMRL